MNNEDIIQAVESLLRGHAEGIYGYPRQEPYKGQFFRQFANAFNAGWLDRSAGPNFLSAEILTETIAAREPDLAEQEAWKILYSFWQEWAYAWNHSNLKIGS